MRRGHLRSSRFPLGFVFFLCYQQHVISAHFKVTVSLHCIGFTVLKLAFKLKSEATSVGFWVASLFWVSHRGMALGAAVCSVKLMTPTFNVPTRHGDQY